MWGRINRIICKRYLANANTIQWHPFLHSNVHIKGDQFRAIYIVKRQIVNEATRTKHIQVLKDITHAFSAKQTISDTSENIHVNEQS